MKKRWYIASKLCAHWGLGITLGAIAGHDAIFLGIVTCALGQISGYLFWTDYKKQQP